jgi:hypothetical protein
MAVPAVAATYVSSGSTLGTSSPQNISISQFDPSLGTLSSITIQYSSTFNGTIGAENQLSLGGPVQVTYSAVTLVSGPSTNFSPALFVSSSPDLQFTATAFDGSTDYAGTSGITVPISQTTLTQTQVLPASTPGYTGTGTVSFLAQLSDSTTGSGPGQLAITSAMVPEASLTVTYEYIPVPEPSITLLASVAAGTMLRRRRENSVRWSS